MRKLTAHRSLNYSMTFDGVLTKGNESVKMTSNIELNQCSLQLFSLQALGMVDLKKEFNECKHKRAMLGHSSYVFKHSMRCGSNSVQDHCAHTRKCPAVVFDGCTQQMLNLESLPGGCYWCLSKTTCIIIKRTVLCMDVFFTDAETL